MQLHSILCVCNKTLEPFWAVSYQNWVLCQFLVVGHMYMLLLYSHLASATSGLACIFFWTRALLFCNYWKVDPVFRISKVFARQNFPMYAFLEFPHIGLSCTTLWRVKILKYKNRPMVPVLIWGDIDIDKSKAYGKQ